MNTINHKCFNSSNFRNSHHHYESNRTGFISQPNQKQRIQITTVFLSNPLQTTIQAHIQFEVEKGKKERRVEVFRQQLAYRI